MKTSKDTNKEMVENTSIENIEENSVVVDNDIATKKDKKESKSDKSQKDKKESKSDKSQKDDKKSKKKNKVKKPSKIKKSFKETKSELKKVTWPTFKTVLKKTGVVISIVTIAAVFVFGIDLLFSYLYSLLINLI